MLIKFNKKIIQSNNEYSITFKTTILQNNFLNQFSYCSIIKSEIHKNQNNSANFTNLIGISYINNTNI